MNTAIMPISPVNIDSRNPNPIRDIQISGSMTTVIDAYIQEHVEAHEGTYHVGLIIAAGHLELLDFAHTQAFMLAQKCDTLAIWVPRNVTYPPAIAHGPRELVTDGFAGSEKYHELNALLKMLVQGIEHQLIRKVCAIGVEQEIGVHKDEEYRGESWQTTWVAVPLSEKERFPGEKKKE